jgi:hypothetical protein
MPPWLVFLNEAGGFLRFDDAMYAYMDMYMYAHARLKPGDGTIYVLMYHVLCMYECVVYVHTYVRIYICICIYIYIYIYIYSDL